MSTTLATLADEIQRAYPGLKSDIPQVIDSFFARRLIDKDEAVKFDPDDLSTTYGNLLAADANSAQLLAKLNAASICTTGFLRVKSASGAIGYATGAGGAVTQGTNSATAVVLNTPSGQVTTVALTTAAGAEEVFTLTNSKIAATDTVSVGTTYAGAGTPTVSVKGIAAGSCVIVITNLHASNALNAAMVINFNVIKGVAA